MPRPWKLTWSDVDPARHPYPLVGVTLDRTRAAVLAAVPAARALARTVSSVDSADPISRVLAGAYGPWATGWRWGMGEADLGGGVVRSWCCATHSLRGDDGEIADRAIAALGEWRGWIEELDRVFAESAAGDGERAYARIVTLVAERTGAEDAWYTMCETVMAWFLEYTGRPAERARTQARKVTRGRFESWVAPAADQLDAMARDAAAVLDRR